MFEKIFLALLIFVPIAVIAAYTGVAPTTLFFLSGIAIIPLAKYIGEATEELAARTTPALGGILGATFGNATELIIGAMALRAGLIEVVKASITGSIISNLLFVLGAAMLAGGWKRERQSFNRMSALASGSALFIAVIALVMPAIFLQTAPGSSDMLVQHLSIFVSLVLIGLYVANLVFSLRTHKHLYIEEVAHYEPRWSFTRAFLTLGAATILVGYMSEILVASIEPVVETFNWSPLFVGVIVIAVIGNIAEHLSAVTVAAKGKISLSLEIAIGSAAQIAMLVAPLLVLLSVVIAHPMSLVFNTFELVSIVLSVLIVNVIISDGESNWLEGVQLLAAYFIMAIAFFFHS